MGDCDIYNKKKETDLIGLLDCNNFFVSCERVFRPDLIGKPVVVLSNNDGCVIARSEEAKKLGIRMGDPYFKWEKFFQENGVTSFSSNYTLYGDLSARVMNTVKRFVPDVEIYSIDECFLYFEGYDHYDLAAYGRIITQAVKRCTGIPVSLGIAPTKTLAKIAGKFAKKYAGYQGVCMIDSEEKRVKALQLFPVGDVWGIGRQYEKLLNYNEVKTAFDFTQRTESWVRKNLKVVGIRTWKELQGVPCILKEKAKKKKNICTSRSFGEMVCDFETLSEAVANFAAACARKLREEKTAAREVQVFILTNPFREDLAQYYKQKTVTLPVHSNHSNELVAAAKRALREIYVSGFRFKKAGVVVSDIVPENEIQGNLFYGGDFVRLKKIHEVMDRINKAEGRNTLKIASQGFSQKWRLKNQFLSKRFTTRWDELPEIR